MMFTSAFSKAKVLELTGGQKYLVIDDCHDDPREVQYLDLSLLVKICVQYTEQLLCVHFRGSQFQSVAYGNSASRSRYE